MLRYDTLFTTRLFSLIYMSPAHAQPYLYYHPRYEVPDATCVIGSSPTFARDAPWFMRLGIFRH